MRRSEVLRILNEVVSSRQPDKLEAVREFMDGVASTDQLDALRNILADEFVDTGLDQDDEPNARGLLLDEVVGIISERMVNMWEDKH